MEGFISSCQTPFDITLMESVLKSPQQPSAQPQVLPPADPAKLEDIPKIQRIAPDSTGQYVSRKKMFPPRKHALIAI